MPPNRLLALLTLLATLAFHLWQNHSAQHGGPIALPKSLWLGLTLYCWLLQPPLIIRRAPNPRAKTVWRLFWALMLARAAAELWLLYGAHQWQYRYGIAHDLLSASLLLIGAHYAQTQPQRQPETERNHPHPNPTSPEIHHMHIIAAMFLCEALFAYYISHF
ncbi:MAG: hypothetical protein ACFNLD_03240, partial [Kingella oralis]